jgi:hypothetical protein
METPFQPGKEFKTLYSNDPLLRVSRVHCSVGVRARFSRRVFVCLVVRGSPILS